MGADGAEADKDLVVDGSFYIHQGSDNAFDLPDTLVFERRAVLVFGGILSFCTINNGYVLVGGNMKLLGVGVIPFEAEVEDVVRHGKATGAMGVFPFDIDASV